MGGMGPTTPWRTPPVYPPEAPSAPFPHAMPPPQGHPSPMPPPDPVGPAAWAYGAPGGAPWGIPQQPYGAGQEDTYDAIDDPYEDDADAVDVEDIDDEPSERGGCARLAVAMGIIAALLCAVLVVAGLWVSRKINPGGPPGESVTVELVSGESTPEIAQALENDRVISDARVFTVYAWVRGSGGIQAGTYELRTNMAMGDVLGALAAGPEPEPPPEGQPVTIPEGLTVQQTVDRLVDPEEGVPGFDADTLLETIATGSVRSRYLPDDQSNVEGILFPETYNMQQGVTELEFLERMVAELEATLSELNVETRADQRGLTPYEVLIVASLIEEETRIDEERPMVARVIYNRLADGMPLGIDATSCYEIAEDPCRLTTADLESDSPYNTRNRPGLPPTPIASPGRASLEAALGPAEGDWLYYVRNDDEGGHLFTADPDEFVRARQTCIEQGWGCG